MATMKTTFESLLAKMPQGERYIEEMAHGTMSVGLYAPSGVDPQKPHDQDELYFIHSGSGMFRLGDARHSFEPGTCFFVPAGVEHRFEQFTDDFAAWVVFWGPKGGEQA